MRKILPFLFLFVLIACGPPKDHLTDYQKTRTYPIEGKCVEPVAAVVIERNGRFDVQRATGSASLEIKETGIFSTANHVVFLDTEYKLFFCGRVYKARRILDPGISDVGFLKITDSFDPATFPEPYELAESVQRGEPVFIRGIHMHPEKLQEGKIIHHIVREYYGLTDTAEFVYDDLSALITEKDVLIPNSSFENQEMGGLGDVVLNNFSARAIHDHKFSFGGLSGGPTVNRMGQKVGINSNGPADEGETILEFDGIYHYYPVVTMNLLPVDELKRALERLKQSR